MARITVEDCEKIIENRFELVVLTAERARQLAAGEKITIEEKKDEKKTVIALREIAEETVSPESLKERVIDKFRAFTSEDEMEEDLDELMEEDTYVPYVGMEVQALENNTSNGISIVDNIESQKL